MSRPLVMIVGHGSRDAVANEEFEQLVALYQQRRPEFEVRHGYIELAQPSLVETLTHLGRDQGEVTLLPLFLFAAGHVKKDIPLAVKAARHNSPGLRFRLSRELGIHRALVDVVLERAASVMSLEEIAGFKPTVVIVARGSSDPAAIDDFRRIAQLLAETNHFNAVVPCFAAVAQPGLAETLESVLSLHPDRLLIIPYFLFKGRVVNQLHEQVAEAGSKYPTTTIAIAPHLGTCEQLLQVMDERVSESLPIRLE